MPIMLNTILAEAGVSPSDVRLVRHQDTRFNQSPFQMWRDDRKMFELYQSHQNVQNRARFGEAYYWASFLGLPNNETMFVGLYRVESRLTLETDKVVPYMPEPEQAGIVDYYDLRLDEHLREFDGKLFVDWGFGMRTWIQRADQQNKPVTELRRQFKEPDFPGHMNFIEPLSRLEVLPKTWIEILRHSKGVYLLTCPRTKEQYVGKAEGDNGFYGRWCEYLQSGHGGNIAVKSREPSDYQVSILEVAGSNPSPEAILEMESRWKSKLQSREMGLNRN